MPPQIRFVITEAGAEEQPGAIEPKRNSRGGYFEEDVEDIYFLGTVVELVSDLTEGGVPTEEWRKSGSAVFLVETTTDL